MDWAPNLLSLCARIRARIRLDVSSSNFPRYDRNSNAGGAIAEESVDDLVVARNSVLHGPGQPGRLILPVIRR